jgi:hypothetical protein
MEELTKEELDELFGILHLLDRHSPYIVTEINNHKNHLVFLKVLQRLQPYVILEHIESPKKLFNFLKEHQKELVVIKDDIFSKRKNYLDIVQGAVCSSPDSMHLWRVYYLQEKDFAFRGKIILCTNKTKQEIKSNKKFEYFYRDCHFI